MMHQLLEQFDEPFASNAPFLVGTKPEGPARIDRRGGRDRLALTRGVAISPPTTPMPAPSRSSASMWGIFGGSLNSFNDASSSTRLFASTSYRIARRTACARGVRAQAPACIAGSSDHGRGGLSRSDGRLPAWPSCAGGTAPGIVSRLSREIASNIAVPDFERRIAATGGAEIAGGSPEEFRAILASDLERWRQMARQINLKSD